MEKSHTPGTKGRRRPDLLIILTEEQVQKLGLPGTADLVIASYSLGYGYCATYANVQGYGATGKDFLYQVLDAFEPKTKHIVIQTVQGVVVYENKPREDRVN